MQYITDHLSHPVHAGIGLQVPMFALIGVLSLLFAVAPVSAQSVQPEYRADEVLVKFRDGASVLGVRQALAARPGHAQVTDDIEVVGIRPGESVEQVILELEALPEVEYAEPNIIRYTQQISPPNDPLFDDQWGLDNTGQSFSSGLGGNPGADIHALEAWDITTGSDQVIVALLDSGVDLNHPELTGNLWNGGPGSGAGVDFLANDVDPQDEHGHGTQMAGIIAAAGDNGRQIAGIAWDVSLMVLRVNGANGAGLLSTLLEGIEYAVNNGADIINISLGSNQFSQAERDALEDAGRQGVLVVAAACNFAQNNDNDDPANPPCYPASHDLPNIISVAATDNSDALSTFSNYGEESVDLGAPGEVIRTLNIVGNPNPNPFISGTSASAAFVSGAAALLLAQNPSLSPAELKDILLSTVDPAPNLAGRTVTGGRLNLAAALQSEAATAQSATGGGNQGGSSVSGGSGLLDGAELFFLLGLVVWLRGYRARMLPYGAPSTRV